jgi:hypothetical protein
VTTQHIQSNLGALFAGISLQQWIALTPHELVRAHLNLDPQTLVALDGEHTYSLKAASADEK